MDSSNNFIYKNAFVGNSQNGYCDSGCIDNHWDYYSNGNYWSDYTTEYPSATNNGFVWNTPYELPDVPATNYDYYPLVTPFVFLLLNRPFRRDGAAAGSAS